MEKIIGSYERGLVGARAFVDLFDPEFELVDIHRSTLIRNPEQFKHALMYIPQWRDQIQNPEILALLGDEFKPWDIEPVSDAPRYQHFGIWQRLIFRKPKENLLDPGWPEFIHPEGGEGMLPWLDEIGDELQARLTKLGFKKGDMVKYRYEVSLRKDLRIFICPTEYHTMLVGIRKRVTRPKGVSLKVLAPLLFRKQFYGSPLRFETSSNTLWISACRWLSFASAGTTLDGFEEACRFYMEHADEYSNFIEKIYQDPGEPSTSIGPGLVERVEDWSALDGPSSPGVADLVEDPIDLIFAGLSTSPAIDCALWKDRESGRKMIFFHYAWLASQKDFFGFFFFDKDFGVVVSGKIESLVYDVVPTGDQVNAFLTNIHGGELNGFIEQPPSWAFALKSNVVQLGAHGLLMGWLPLDSSWSKLNVLHWVFARIFPPFEYLNAPNLAESVGGFNPALRQFDVDFFIREYIRGFPVYLPYVEQRVMEAGKKTFDPADGAPINRGSYEPALADWDGKPYSDLGAFRIRYDAHRAQDKKDA